MQAPEILHQRILRTQPTEHTALLSVVWIGPAAYGRVAGSNFKGRSAAPARGGRRRKRTVVIAVRTPSQRPDRSADRSKAQSRWAVPKSSQFYFNFHNLRLDLPFADPLGLIAAPARTAPTGRL